MANKYDIVHVIRCEDCIHFDEGEYCEMIDYDRVKPCEFCWYGQTADGREPKELDVIPVEWIKKYMETDDIAGSIFRMVEDWRLKDGEENND